MSRTLLGTLVLRLRTEGLGEAGKITQTMKDIENAARRVGTAGVGSWGVGFQKQLNTLKLTAQEVRAVERSWINLHNSMSSRNLAKAAKSAEISHWRTNTIGELAKQRAVVERHYKALEAIGTRHALRMRDVMKASIVATGVGYTAPYAAGMAIRGGLTAASEQTRTKYRLELANVDPAEIKKMEAESARLSAKYGSIDEQDILELNRASYALMGGDGDKARSLMEPIIRSFIADVTAVGVEKAGENLSSFLKAMDNLNVNEGADGGVDNIEAILEGWTKAKQIEGKDLDVGDLLGLARRAKVAKYAFSDEFLADHLPALGQDMGFEALGDALSGAYQNFVTPSSGGTQGQYVKRQKAAGLRDENNSLIERDLFATNPYRWTLDVLKPLLAKNGVDTENTAAVAEATVMREVSDRLGGDGPSDEELAVLEKAVVAAISARDSSGVRAEAYRKVTEERREALSQVRQEMWTIVKEWVDTAFAAADRQIAEGVRLISEAQSAAEKLDTWQRRSFPDFRFGSVVSGGDWHRSSEQQGVDVPADVLRAVQTWKRADNAINRR